MVLVATLAAVAVATAVMIPVLLKMMVGYAVLCVAMLSVALALLYAYFPLVRHTHDGEPFHRCAAFLSRPQLSHDRL